MKVKFNNITTLLLILICYSLNGQIKVKGIVKNDFNQKAVEFANVVLTNENNKIITGTITDDKGLFNLSVKKGYYNLTISFIGYEKWSKNISISKDLDMGDISLIEKTTELEELVITSKKKLIQRKVDRLVFNVRESISSTGGDAVDVLKITPLLRVNDEISMIGKSGVALMVNDRLMRLSRGDLLVFLKTIRSEDIEQIEVITNPPAKYDAEGNSGIVNIRLRKAKKDNWNISLRTQYEQSTYDTEAFSGRFSYRKNKFSFSSGISYVNGSSKRVEKDEVYYTDKDWITEFNKKMHVNSLAGKILIDYDINKKWSIGTQYYILNNLPLTEERDKGLITSTTTRQLDSLIITEAKNKKHNQLNNVNLYSKIKLDTLGKSVNIDLTYLDYKNDNDRNFATNTFLPNDNPTQFGYKSNIVGGKQKIKNYAGIIDIEHPSKWMNFNYGLKVSSINTKNEINAFDLIKGTPIINENQSNIFEFTEKTQALYISGSKEINDKWKIKLGLRLENTQTEGYSKTINKTNKNNYTELFPTFYLSYDYNEDNTFSFNYGRRIKRPNYSSLNPFKFYSSPYSYNEGNPFLTPQFSNIVEFQYGYKGKLFTTISFINENQGFGEIPIVDSNTNIQFFTYLNYFTLNGVDLSQSYQFNILKWWNSFNSINIYYSENKLDSNIELKNTKGWGAYFSSNNSFVLNKSKTIKGELNFWYQSPETDLLYNRDAKYNLDLGIRFSLLKNKNLQLNITVNDIFRTNKNKQITFTNDIKQIYSSYGDNQRFKISISYFFGGKKAKYKRKYFGNESEKNRI